MKKLTFLLVIVALLTALSPAAVSAYTISATLYAGQTAIAGYVKIWNDADNLYVDIWMRGGAGWCLNESHVHVATSLDDVPRTKSGSPKPGHFDYKATHDCVNGFTHTISLEDGWYGEELIVVVHAVVTGPDGQEETSWAVRCGNLDDVQFRGPGWSAYLVFTKDAWE